MESVQDALLIKDVENAVIKLCDFIKHEVTNRFQKSGAIVGLSGGVDSAVTAALCTRSLGTERILGLIMPEKESDPTSQIHAEKLAKQLKIKFEIVDITPILNAFGVYANKERIIREKFPDFNANCKYRIVVPPKFKSIIGIPFLEILDDKDVLHKLKISSSEFLSLTAATSIKHRVRMTLLYFYGEKNNLCVMGTTNKSEYLQGYFVKYGDGGSDIEPLVNLYKLQIYQLGRFLKIPDEILTKEASPDVWSFATTDEEFFYSVPYDVVDLLLYAREKKLSTNEIQQLSKLSTNEIENLLKIQNQKLAKSYHMREMPHSWIPDFT
ncbi:MAG: NAD(+) synthase [Candidatus Nitrosotenuis sp.]